MKQTSREALTESSTGLGHLAAQMASRGMGMRVIGVDHGSKKDLVLESGAEHFIDHTQTKDVGAAVKELTGGLGAQAVLVLTAANAAYARFVSFQNFFEAQLISSNTAL